VDYQWKKCPTYFSILLLGAGEDTEAIDYFWYHLARIKETEGPLEGMIECIQRPGETIYVPGGWWHAVLNLDDTMAVTQNFCNSANFDNVWRSMRVQRYQLARYFLFKLSKKNPALYKRAIQLNSLDHFIPFENRIVTHHALNVSTDSYSDSSSDSSESSSKSLSSDEEEEQVNNIN
jgi:histone arginine demethylase JMJD6